MARYRSIVFIDHEEEQDDNGTLVTDRALKILHHKTDDSVLWECPTAESVQAAFDYLLQWDCEESGEVTDASPAGSSDWTETVTRDGRTYEMAYNVGLSYIGLSEVTETEMPQPDREAGA